MRVAVSCSLSLPLLAGVLAGAAACAQSVSITPPTVEAGSPEVIRIAGSKELKLEGDWLGRKLRFFRGKDAWYALAGVDVEAEPGPSTLRITVSRGSEDGRARVISTPVVIHAAHYRSGVLSVPPKFVEPGPDEQVLIAADRQLKEKVFAAAEAEAGEPLWSGNFAAPVKTEATDSFGTRRTFNGKLASIHKGTDFRAAAGTPVLAGNAGTVVLAQPLYYEGNCVMIDHGLGLMSISMHLSRIDVQAGAQVSRGEQIGLSGATGRVTGPHLHWAIRWQGAYLDPAKVLQLDLDSLR